MSMIEHGLRPNRSSGSGGKGRPARLGAGHALALLIAVAVALAVDAVVRSRGEFDRQVLDRVRGIDFPGAKPLAEALYDAGDPAVLLVAWVVGVAAFGVLRRWLELAAWVSLAFAGALAWTIALAIGRPRPAADDVGRAVPLLGEFGEAAFPSVTTLFLVLLVGFLVVLTGGVRSRWRWPARVGLVFLAAGAGWASVWLGRHWVGDVIAGYAVGLLVLAGVATAYGRMTPVFGRLPLVRAAPVPHRADQPHAHALTSLVLFEPGLVSKVYSPGFIPRFIYWLAFQAPFAYTYNESALSAAVLRRNLAGMLTEYWFGRRLVATAIGVGAVDGRPALVSRYTAGTAPRDTAGARAFLRQLADRFDAAGLPTWQVDPRQPRAMGNLLETPSGDFVVIDLESGLVSPLASPRTWWRAIRRARVPLFDDVFFDVTRAYTDREEERMRAAMGDAWLTCLRGQIDGAETAQDRWHSGEPRFWSALLRFVWTGFGVGSFRRWLGERRRKGTALALSWLGDSIDRWEAEGRYSAEAAESVRRRLDDPGLQDVLPHFGVHLVIGITLRFPFGSLARATYTLANLLTAVGALLLRRSDFRGFRRALSIHSPLVIVVAAMPGIGTFSYLLSGPMLANHRLWRVAIDSVGLRFPFHVYERLGARRVIAGRAHRAAAGGGAG